VPTLTEHNGVHVLHLGNGENRFTLDWMTEMENTLDQVIASPAPMVTVGEGKHYSSGLDLDWVLENPDRLPEYVARVEALLGRLLTLPVPTIAAINGHAFGAGAMLAMAHDWRIMRADRGFFCFPEVDIQIPFTAGMAALIQAKLTPRVALDAMTTGLRFSGPEAVDAGLIEMAADEAEVLATAVGRVAPLTGKHAETLGAIKRTMYADVITELNGEAA
jgi:enoyl-CoA hydratase/carnithine racemase